MFCRYDCSSNLGSTPPVESFQKLSTRYLSQKVFGYLVTNALHEKSHRRALEKCVLRWRCVKMAGAFDRWHSARERKQKIQAVGSKIIARWRNMGMCAPFSKWAADVAHKKAVQHRMRKMVLMWSNRSTRAALERWVEHTAEVVCLKNTTFRVVARWQNKTIADAFGAWTGHWAELKARAERAEKSTSRVRAVTYRMIFDPKKSDPSMMTDLKRFETSLLADVLQVLALCPWMLLLASQMQSQCSTHAEGSVYVGRLLLKCSRKMGALKQKRRFGSRTHRQGIMLLKSNTLRRKLPKARRLTTWQMRSASRWAVALLLCIAIRPLTSAPNADQRLVEQAQTSRQVQQLCCGACACIEGYRDNHQGRAILDAGVPRPMARAGTHSESPLGKISPVRFTFLPSFRLSVLPGATWTFDEGRLTLTRRIFRFTNMSSIIKRMVNMATAGAFELWLMQSSTARDQRSKCIQIVQKLLHRKLAMAFDGFVTMVVDMRERRVAVRRTLFRWKTLYVQAAFDQWLE